MLGQFPSRLRSSGLGFEEAGEVSGKIVSFDIMDDSEEISRSRESGA